MAARTRWPAARRLLAPLLLLAALGGLTASSPRAQFPGAPFQRLAEVQKLLQSRCLECHGGKKTRGGLDLSRREALLRGGDSGPAVVAGDAKKSRLHHLVSGSEKPVMPASGARLSAAEVALLASWIDSGAPYAGPLVARAQKADSWWSLAPIVKRPPPAAQGKHSSWPRNPIDQFVLAKLRDQGLEPSPPADRRTLLRRVTFDLIGLPPTPEEIDAFLADRSADAWEKVVDRLLASPHYGERWARHWMDVIHFAETHGHDQDVPRDHAWPYRDYLIRSLNADKPYGRFVEEQLAGDILYPSDPQATVALGFLAAGPWDESSLRDIREDSIDRKAGQYLDRDDMVGTVSLAFLSATVQCARCHDHKFDPISQEEYYGLQAVFAGVDRADRPYDEDPAVRARRVALERRKAELQGGPDVAARLLKDPAIAADVAAWEKARAASSGTWRVLDPVVFRSVGGSEAVKLPDGSVRFGGKRPDKDTYVFEATTDLETVTALQLEVLTDKSLPHHGPGRQDNGNLHLSEIKVEVEPAADPGKRHPVALARALADFNQSGWEVTKAIDGRPETAWGIYPEVGKPHTAVFVFREPVRLAGGARLYVTLEQLHGAGHLIGRPRLSVTDAPAPASGAPLPLAVERILAKIAGQRTDREKAELALHVLREQVEAGLAALPPAQLVYAAAADFTPQGSFRPAGGCRPIHVLRRGDVRKPGGVAVPGALACVPGLEARFRLANPADEGQRRAALAKWISDPRNPLTWRSIANRLWHHHFGRGIVSTPSDFGRMGALPTHPELFDWLAATLLEDGGSLKQLHRRIVTSATYMQSSAHRPECAKVDSDNAYLWRMTRTRLDAESVRDAVLLVSGQLDRRMGGASVRHFKQSPGIHRTPKVDYLAFDPDSPGGHRRSVYRFIFRTLPDPLLDALDCPDASQFTAARASSVTVLQALALLNDPFMVRMSEHFARRVAPAGSVEEQVRRAYLLALGREPTEGERTRLAGYATRHGMANACRLLLNCNEFLFVP
ncbi:MAG: PSD1 and planctomycete cytochrome C domain-containing protein [Gemmataceae bacterium]|nr:PSD1 and planctomycete cytochrome C domain-containing protein [Gemmataceae bacterium]